MATKTFKNCDLRDLASGDTVDGLEEVSNLLTGTSRWAVQYRLVFKDTETGKFYEANYQRGATESQDERPFEYDGALVECHEVRPVEKTVVVYERVS